MKLGSQTGSVVNHLHSRATLGQPEPVVGMAATVLGWTDRSAATVRNVFSIRGMRAVQVTLDRAVVVSGSEHDGSAVYEFETTADGSLQTFAFDGKAWLPYVLNADTGRWNRVKSGGLHIGSRDHYRDPSF